MSDQPDQAAAIRYAINNRDIKSIETAYQKLRETDLTSLLDQLATAIEEERYQDAETIFREILNTYEEKRDEEAELSAQVNAARTTQSSSLDTVQDLTTYLREANETRIQRAELVATVSSFLQENLENSDRSESDSSSVQSYSSNSVIDTVRQTKDSENEFVQVAESAESTSSEVTLSPTLRILQITTESERINTGESVPLKVKIKNVGDASATDITVSAETPNSVAVGDSGSDISSLSADNTITESLSITAQTQGSHAITITATGEESSTTLTETIVASADTSIPEPYSLYVNDDGYVRQSGLNEAIGAYLRGNLSDRELNTIIGAYLSEERIDI